MVPTREQLYKVFVDVTYNYDVYAQVINDIIAHNNYNKVRGNK